MITNESEIRIALQALLTGVLALYGFWGCAFVMLLLLLPWKPILAAGGYLVQPLVDWHIDKWCDRRKKEIAQNEYAMNPHSRLQEINPLVSAPPANGTNAAPAKPSCSPFAPPLESFETNPVAGAGFSDIPAIEQKCSALLEIPPAIKQHVGNLLPGVFTNMNLEVERVTFEGDTAEACVRLQSPNVTELVIRQRYVLRKSDDHWQVESHQPANSANEAQPHSLSAGRPRLHVV